MASCRGEAAAWGRSLDSPSLLPTLNRGAQPCPLSGKHLEESSGQRAKVRLQESRKHPVYNREGWEWRVWKGVSEVYDGQSRGVPAAFCSRCLGGPLARPESWAPGHYARPHSLPVGVQIK